MAGILLSLLGALLGAAAWVGISTLPIPVFLAGIAACAVGLGAGYGMRLGAKSVSTVQRGIAVAFALVGSVLGRYGQFVCHTAKFRSQDVWADPRFLSPETAKFFADQHLLSLMMLLLLAVAAYFAWRASSKA